MNEELCFRTATELRGMLDRKEISATELLDAHLTQIQQVNPGVNAIVTLAEDRARRLAKMVDSQILRGEPVGVLAGLPVAHKDLVNTRGIRTTFGSRIFEHHVPDENALIVQRIVDAGGVTLGKTNVPEWGAGSQTFNDVFGTTVNPWDTTRTCGGSSGGAAVALATGMIPMADGSDMGGSLRNPASFCNVVGFRTSPGRVPIHPAELGWQTLSVLGPMARTVEDCALLLAAIAGPDPRVPISINEPGSIFAESLKHDFKGCRIAISPDFDGQLPVAREVRSIVRDSATHFESVGCVIESTCPDFSGANEVFQTLRAWSFAAAHKERLAARPELYKDSIIWNVEKGLSLSGEDISRAERQRTTLYQRVAGFLEEYDFLVLPVSQVAPFDASTEYPTEIEGVRMETYIDWMKSCYYISCLGFPAISVPCGFTPEGLPVGIQIIGAHQQDLAVLRLARAFEEDNPAWRKRPPRPDL